MARRPAFPQRLGLLTATILFATGFLPAQEIVLADSGKSQLPILVPRDATPSERAAAEELAEQLKRVTGARFRVKTEKARKRPRKAIYVGPTEFASAAGVLDRAAQPEAWRVIAKDGSLVLAGGRPRGTLYAVYHFLEGVVGVRWWTPWEDDLPQTDRLRIPALDLRGQPAFVYRDIYGTLGPRLFWARNRVNGHFTYLPARHGGRVTYGPPDHVHNFFRYVSPDEYFDEHPEYFAEVDGERTSERAQLCLTNVELARLISGKLRDHIEQSRLDARRRGEPPPTLFAISQNDVGGACTCGPCGVLLAREGSHAGALVQFINQVASSVADDYPEVLIDTLAYSFTLDPPQGLSYADNVSVRLAGLYGRDFSKPVTDPVHRWYREAIEGWSRRTRHLRIWDYIVTFGQSANLPLPNLPVLAVDLRYYLDHGVEGVFIQQNRLVLSDMRDLKLWVTTKLIENPRLRLDDLVTEFTDGYYRAAGAEIRQYLAMLETAVAHRPPTLGYPTAPEDYGYLDGPLLFQAHEILDRAEELVENDAELLARVRRARFSLDRATVLLWEDRFGLESLARDAAGRELDLREIAERGRDTAHTTIEQRIPETQRDRERRKIDRELGGIIAPYMERDAAAEP